VQADSQQCRRHASLWVYADGYANPNSICYPDNNADSGSYGYSQGYAAASPDATSPPDSAAVIRFTDVVATGLWPVHPSHGVHQANGP
jgi:hypothetical protein